MLTKALFVIVAISATLNLSSALRCNMCLGAIGGECDQGKKSAMANIECYENFALNKNVVGYKTPGATDEDIEFMCVKIAYAESEEISAFASNACGYAPKGEDLCKFLEAEGVATSCSVCNTDLCNL